MGMWDETFAKKSGPPGIGTMLTSMIPIVGPIAAIVMDSNRRKKEEQQWYDENAAFYPDKDYSPDTLSGRIAQRMLTRTGGETTIPGIMAATALSRQAKNEENQGNFGNVAMAAAVDLAKTRPDLAAQMAMIAHKNLQTPWKPSEGKSVRRDENTGVPLTPEGVLAPNAVGYVKADNVEQGDETLSGYWVTKTDENGNIADRQLVTNAKGPRYKPGEVNVKVDAGIGMAMDNEGVRKEIIGLGGSINEFKDQSRQTKDLIGILDRNPSGGVTGWSGIVTEFAGKGLNLAQFMTGLGSKINANGETEQAVMGRWVGKLNGLASKLPINDQAMANSIIIQVAYTLARTNNMGTAGGGRGITDNDMEYAMQQLASATTPEAFKKVLIQSQRRAAMKLRDMAGNTDIYIKAIDPRAELPPAWTSYIDSANSEFDAPPPAYGDQELDDIMNLYLPKQK